IREAFLETGKIWTGTLLERLKMREESPWKDIGRGKELDDRGLADMLRPYSIKSRDVKIDGVNRKCYLRTDFIDAWIRYLPSPSSTSATSATDLNDKRNEALPEALPERYPNSPFFPGSATEKVSATKTANVNNAVALVAPVADDNGNDFDD